MAERNEQQTKTESYEDLFGNLPESEARAHAKLVAPYFQNANITYEGDKIDEINFPLLNPLEAASLVKDLDVFLQTVWEQTIMRGDTKMIEVSLTNPKDFRRLQYLGIFEQPVEEEVPEPTQLLREKISDHDLEDLRSILARAQYAFNGLEISSITLPTLVELERDFLGPVLTALDVYPSIRSNDEGEFLTIELPGDIQKFVDLEIINPQELRKAQIPTGFEFPLRPQPPIERKPTRRPQQATQTSKSKAGSAEVTEVDIQMEEERERFLSGQTEDREVRGKSPFTGRGLPRRYDWREGKLYSEDGELVEKAEIRNLIEQAKTDERALAKVMDMNEGLVHYVYRNLRRKFSPNHRIDADDLLQAGRLGLMDAIGKHDGSFSGYQSYFIKYIEGYMRNELRKRRIVRLPSDVYKFQKPFYDALRELEAEHGPIITLDGAVSLEDIAEKSGLPLETVHRLGELVFSQTSEDYDEERGLEYAEKDQGQERLHESSNPSEDAIDSLNLKEVTGTVLNSLQNPREELVIRLRYAIVDDAEHWKDGTRIEEISHIQAKEDLEKSISKLKSKDTLDLRVFKELTPAERILCVLIGKLPPQAVADLNLLDKEVAASTLEDITKLFGLVSRDRIRQIEAKALRNLKHPSRARKLRSFLDS